MTAAELQKIETELSFISRTAGRIEGAGEDDWQATDAIQRAVNAIREMLLDMQPACEEIPAGVALAA
jgi:hypothetical protein